MNEPDSTVAAPAFDRAYGPTTVSDHARVIAGDVYHGDIIQGDVYVQKSGIFEEERRREWERRQEQKRKQEAQEREEKQLKCWSQTSSSESR